MSNYQRDENEIPGDFVQKWRRDIVKINPVIKINCNGENIAQHTAPYPKEIPEMAIRYFSGVGDLVLDPFMGSGTTAVACTELDRHYIGYEIHTEYIDVASARINEAKIERQSKLW
jgi:DNA modification methylase